MPPSDADRICERLESVESEIDTIRKVVLGPDGHPEQSLVVQVQSIASDVVIIKRVMIWMATLAGGALIASVLKLVIK